MSRYQLSIIVAVQHAQQNLPAIVDRLDMAAHDQVEFIFCTTPADADTAGLVAVADNVRIINCAAGSLIPHLWRDGIQTAGADRVALTTAHCIPCADWVEQLLQQDLDTHPGIGGVIDNDAMSGARDWAIFILRYIAFASPQAQREVDEIAADNAIYNRNDIVQHEDLLSIGFWEPSFHSRFRRVGKRLLLQPKLCVVHCNAYTTAQFFQQRLAHGREFGLARARQISNGRRYILIALSPLLPGLFLLKIVRNVMRGGRYRARLISASPWLLWFLLAWGIGEAIGYLAYRPHAANKEKPT